MAGTPDGQVLDHYLHSQYEVIRIVHDNLDAIRAIASHLTPVEDLVDFREEVTALYVKLGALTTASELILSATPSGIALLTAADAAAQRLLLELGTAAIHEAEYFATADGLAAAEAAIAQLNTQMDQVLLDLAEKASADDLAALTALVDDRFAGTDVSLADLDARITQLLNDVASGAFTLQLRVDVDAHEVRLDEIEAMLATQMALLVEVDNGQETIGDQIVGFGSLLETTISRVTENEDGAEIMLGRVITIETELENLATGQLANSTAIQSLISQTSMISGDVFTQSQAITSLSSRLDQAEGELDAAALALQTLTTQVNLQGAQLTVTSDFTTQLASRITDAETNIDLNANALSSLSTTVTQLGNDLTIASEDIVALKAEIGSTGNLAPNAGFEADTHGWSIFNRGAGWTTAQLGRNEDAATQLPLSMNALSVAVATQPAGKLGIKSDNLPTRGGQRYILSGWLATVNCTATLEWRLLNQDGAIIQFGSLGSSRDGGTTNINDWPRLWGEIPANAAARELQIQVWIQEVTAAGPKLWLLRPMLEEVSGLQDGPSAWVPGVTGLAKATADAVSILTARIDGVDGDLTVTASQILTLNANLDTTQAALVNEMITRANQYGATSASINSLSSRMVDAESELDAQATAIGVLETEVSTIDGVVSSHSGSLISLQAQVDAIDEGTGGAGAAISSLNTRVTATEGSIDSLSDAVTALESSVVSANKIYAQDDPPSTTGRTTGDLWIDTNDGNKVYTLAGGVWVARPDNNRNRIFAQADQPTATNIGDLWIEIDNGNKVWMWNGTTWIDASDARTTANATAISNLTTRTTAAEGTITSQSASITTLTSGVTGAQTTANNAVAAAAAAQTSANTALNTLSDIASDSLLTPGEKPAVIRERDTLLAESAGIEAQAISYGIGLEKTAYLNAMAALTSYLATLTTPVLWSNLSGNTTIVGTTFRTKFGDVYSTRQTLLNRIMAATKTALDANASATSALTTRVTAAEGSIVSQANSITTLNSTIAGKADVSAVSALTTRVSEMQGAGRNMLVNTSFQVNLAGWTAEGSVGGTIGRDTFGWTWQPQGMHAMVLQPNSTGTVDSDYYYSRQEVLCEPGKEYIASAYMAAHRCNAFIYLIWFNAAGASFQSSITPNTSLLGAGADLATNYNRMYLKVTAPANARKVAVCFGYRKSIAGSGGDNPYVWVIRPMFEEVGSSQTLPSRWNAGGTEMFASYSLTLDVNGFVSGYQSNNDGTTANFAIVANNFSVVVPGGGVGMSWVNGMLWNKGTEYSVLIGQDISPTSDVIIWVGPNPTSAATASKLDAAFYVTEDGNAVFSGMVYQSIISGSAIELGSTRIHTGGGRLAPFTLRAQGYKGQSGSGFPKFSGTVTLSDFQSPDYGTGYHFKRFSRKKADVSLTAILHGDGLAGDMEALYIDVQYDGGAWTNIISRTSINVDNHGGWMFLIRYTTLESWNTCAFRARSTGGKTVVLAFSLEVDNTYETGNAPGTYSGDDASGGTGGSAPPAPPPPGGGGTDDEEPFCVVADLAYLPSGMLVAEQDIQADFPCWNGDSEYPAIEWHPLLAMPEGHEECFIVTTENGCSVPQSKSTPIPIRGGRLVTTLHALGYEVLTNIDGVLAWSKVVAVPPLGVRRVVKPDLGDRVFFAGMNPRMTIATHNVRDK